MDTTSPRRTRRLLTSCATALVTLTLTAGAADARVDTEPITVIDDQVSLRQFSIAHNSEKNEYFAVWREFDGFVETDVVGALLDAEGKIISGPTIVAEQRSNDSGTSLSGAGFWNTKVVYNAASNQYLALVQRSDTSSLTPVENRRSSTIFGRLVNDTGAPVGAEVRLNPTHGQMLFCLVRNPDVITNPTTGGYTLVYTKWYGTTSTGGICDGLTASQSVTMVQPLDASLGRGAAAQFPIVNEEGAPSPRVGYNPTNGELLVTQPYTGRFQIADNNGGLSFPVQRYSSSLTPLGGPVTVDASPNLGGTGVVTESVPVADPSTGNWFITSTARFGGVAWTNLLSPNGANQREGNRIVKGFPVAIDAVGDGTFVFSTQSGTLVHVHSDGTEIHSTTPFAASIYENTSSVALSSTGGVAIGVAPGNAGIATAVVDVVAPGALPLPPARLLETRDGPDLTTIDGDFEGDGKVAAGSFVALQVAGRGGVPADAEAVLLNIAAAGAPTGGFVTAYPCDAASRPTTSNLNYAAGAAASAAAIAKVAANGTVCIFTSAEAHLIVDVNGYVPGGGSVSPVVPARLLETRAGQITTDGASQAIGRVAANSTTTLKVTGRGGVAADADAVLVNVTAIKPATSAFLTIYPCGDDQPTAANLNAPANGVVNNLTLARVGTNGTICIFSNTETDLAVDVAAFVPSGGGLRSVVPGRFYETRAGLTTVDGQQQATGRIGADRVVALNVVGRGSVPADATGVMLNVAVIRPDTGGFMTLYPCDAERPQAANLNFAANSVVSNAVFVKLADFTNGTACVYSSTGADLAIDVVGFVVDN